jgi:hypothetical protein
MMLGTVRPTRHRSAARVSRGWLVRGVRHERDGCQLDGIHYPQEGEGSRIALIPNAAARPEEQLPLGVFERAGALDHAVVIGERPR